MNPDLELLIQLQDLDLMMRELGNEKAANQEKKLGFTLAGTEAIQAARGDIVAKVNPEWLKLYERVVARFPRAIVPMRDGICFGCFVRQPSKKSAAVEPEDKMETCQRCGRILFRFRFPG